MAFVVKKKNLPENARDTGDMGSISWVGKVPWRRASQPTPVFLPGESHKQKYSPRGHKALDTTELLTLSRVKCIANWEAAV